MTGGSRWRGSRCEYGRRLALGHRITTCYPASPSPSKDARLPVQLQRAMAAEAEAAREARAKVGRR